MTALFFAAAALYGAWRLWLALQRRRRDRWYRERARRSLDALGQS